MRQAVPVRPWWQSIAILGVMALLGGGCSDRSHLPTAPGMDLTAGIEAAPPEPVPGEDEEEPKGGFPVRKPAKFCQTAYAFEQMKFTNPLTIDNPWAPLIPGTQYVLEGRANRGGGPLPHEVVFTVTDVIKDIQVGDRVIPTLVLWDRDYNEGVLAEAELAFFAQDDLGTIWSLGEYPEEFDTSSGEFQGAPNTWIAGLDGTQAGNWMLGDLRRGKGYYSQGFSAPIEFLDCATVLWTRVNDCVPVGCFSNVLVIDEYGPYDIAGGHQRKYYAKGVGNIRIGALNDPEGETLVMTRRKQLTPEELAAARQEVLNLDARGFMFSDVYARTTPAH